MNDWDGLSSDFKRQLLIIDKDLHAFYDDVQESIIIWSKRPGRPKTHEFTSHRVYYENHPHLVDQLGDPIKVTIQARLPELEGWTLKRLKEIDVWQRHGTGKSFDDWLDAKEQKDRENRIKTFKRNRQAIIKEHRDEFEAAIWNAQNGRFTDKTARPYEIAKRISTSANTNKKKESQPCYS